MLLDQIGSMNDYPLFRVRSWNNGVRCMAFYILMHWNAWYISMCLRNTISPSTKLSITSEKGILRRRSASDASYPELYVIEANLIINRCGGYCNDRDPCSHSSIRLSGMDVCREGFRSEWNQHDWCWPESNYTRCNISRNLSLQHPAPPIYSFDNVLYQGTGQSKFTRSESLTKLFYPHLHFRSFETRYENIKKFRKIIYIYIYIWIMYINMKHSVGPYN